MKIFHGSKTKIENPQKRYGKLYNDYGQGFYTTESFDLACEWATSDNCDGVVNEYDLDISQLKVLKLDKSYNILNWLAILLDNRTIQFKSELSKQACDFIKDKFLINYKDYDVIIGYRADDSYFSFSNDFVNNEIPLQTLEDSMYLGTLGLQVFVTNNGFNKIKYINCHKVYSEDYYTKYINRDNLARENYRNQHINIKDSIYIVDILREDEKFDDKKIPRIRIE